MVLRVLRFTPPDRPRTFRSCQSGATAVEFGFVVVPVLTLLLGIVDFSLIAWRSSTLHSGVIVLQSAIQQRNADASNYLSLFCDAAGPLVSCDDDLEVFVRPLVQAGTPTNGNGAAGGPLGSFNVQSGEPFVIETTYNHRMLTPFIEKMVPERAIRTNIVVYSQRAGL